jgi:hypothetical protein
VADLELQRILFVGMRHFVEVVGKGASLQVAHSTAVGELGKLQVVPVEALHIQQLVVHMDWVAGTVQRLEGRIVGEVVDR